MSKKDKKVIKIGDLVTFEPISHLGIVIEKKNAEAFHPEEDIIDFKVLWGNGDAFWCLDFTLRPISPLKD
jgi:hypothetical protein|tara:strand:+ start:2498 stop:2707 length:210 start_codon:yes stop_codon:yes gene_type:complete